MGKKILSLVMIAMMAAMVLSVQPKVHAQITEVRIGWSLPLSADPVTVFLSRDVHHVYYYMIVKDFNDKGGLYLPEAGRRVPIRTIVRDDGAYPYPALYNVDDNYVYLIEVEKCHLVFAPWSTALNYAVKGIYEEYKYPVVGLTVGSNSLSRELQGEEHPWLWLTLAVPHEDTVQLLQVFEYINNKVPEALKIKSVGIYYRGDEHGEEHGLAIRDGLTSAGISVPICEAYDPTGPSTWEPMVLALREANVDVAVVCGYGEVAGFIGECISKDYNPKLIIVGPGLETPVCVYNIFGFTPGQFAGIMYYNGFPACAYKAPAFKLWLEKHRSYTSTIMPNGYLPFPASALFYAGVEALLRAAETCGVMDLEGNPSAAKREAIRDMLETETFNITLGVSDTPFLTIRFRKGLSAVFQPYHGTITQWTGGPMMDVIWPLGQQSYGWIIYPKFPWEWGAVKDVDRNGKVEMVDLWLVAKDFGWRGPPYDKRTDVDNNGKVEMVDLWLVAKDFGKRAPSGGIIPY